MVEPAVCEDLDLYVNFFETFIDYILKVKVVK